MKEEKKKRGTNGKIYIEGYFFFFSGYTFFWLLLGIGPKNTWLLCSDGVLLIHVSLLAFLVFPLFLLAFGWAPWSFEKRKKEMNGSYFFSWIFFIFGYCLFAFCCLFFLVYKPRSDYHGGLITKGLYVMSV